MRKILKFFSLLLILSFILPITSFAAENNLNESNTTNSEQESKDKKIMELIDERQKVLSRDPVNIIELNDIDQSLTSLGVEFLTFEQVQSQFPDAIDSKLTDSVNIDASINATPPDSSHNTWMTYRDKNWYYNGKYYNIQKLIAQPMNENSNLWTEGERTVNFSTNWTAGITNLIQIAASTVAGETVYAPAITVYDAIASAWSGFSKVSEIDPSTVTYRWETQTIAAFQYVRLENQSDSYQNLSHISTKCQTAVAYIVDVDKWRQNSSGTWIPEPALATGNRTLYNTPYEYSSSAEAVYAYTVARALNDSVSNITISGPESKTVQTIYPLYPSFPLDCE